MKTTAEPMRGSGWLLPILALLLWLAAVAWPMTAGAVELLGQSGSAESTSSVEIKPAAVLLAETAAYALIVAIGAMLIGWLPGRLLGGLMRRRGFVLLAMLMLLPICLPAYVVFYAWWEAWPADSALYAWAVANRQIPLLRQATLLAGLLCWSWPLVAWSVAGSVAMIPAQRQELLHLDGAGLPRRLTEALRTDGRGLAIGALLVFLVAFNNTTCFDLAEIYSFGNELRAKDAMGATAGQILTASLPAVALAGCGALLVWTLLGRRPRQLPIRGVRVCPSTTVGVAAIWSVTVLLPVAMLIGNISDWRQLDMFIDTYGWPLMKTVELAAISGLLAVVIAVGLAMAWSDHRPWVRGAAHVQAIGWLLAALAPGTVMGVALEAAYNMDLSLPGASLIAGGGTVAEMVYRQPVILVLGHLGRFAFAAALLGRWIATSEARALADLRRHDGAGTLVGFALAAWPRLLAAGAASLAIVAVLSLSELPVTARVHPPGSDPLAVTLLNAMHYQRPQTVMIASLLLIVGALLAAVVIAIVCAPRRRLHAARIFGLLVACLPFIAGGCEVDDLDAARPLDTQAVFGFAGISPGQFSYPRCIDVDAERGYVYVIDKTARVQRFALDSEHQLMWRMPEMDCGKPTGVSVAGDGTVFVADTHYYRVIAYDDGGNEQMRFGGYGEGPGQFIYPTDIAFGPEGRLYVSEYGGNDRIQVFTSEGEFLFTFGSFGEGEGQFNRPQSLAFNSSRTELYIADACNHRIIVTDPQGRVLRSFGSPGDEPGEMLYPYGLMVLPDGSLLISEFGNSRLQRFSPAGRPLGLFGKLGAGAGELRYPWGLAGSGGMVFVLDSGNNRVQVIEAP